MPVTTHTRKTFWEDFKTFFLKGLAIVLPTVLTLWVIMQVFLFLDAQVAQPINRGIRIAVTEIVPMVLAEEDMPAWFRVTDEQVAAEQLRLTQDAKAAPSREAVRSKLRSTQFAELWRANWYLRFIGLLVAIVIIYFAGLLLGRKLFGRLESILTQLPGFKQIYPHVKQLVDLVLGDKPMAFRHVVLVQYPREGIWTVGLVTSSSLKQVKTLAGGEETLSIFIPSTPMPFTGFTINVPASQTVKINLSIDEAIRFFITGGVLIPDEHANEPMTDSQREALEGIAQINMPTPLTSTPPSESRSTRPSADTESKPKTDSEN